MRLISISMLAIVLILSCSLIISAIGDNLSNTPTSHSSATDVVTDGNNVYVVWSEFDENQINFRRSHNGGVTFGAAITLDADVAQGRPFDQVRPLPKMASSALCGLR